MVVYKSRHKSVEIIRDTPGRYEVCRACLCVMPEVGNMSCNKGINIPSRG